MKRWRIRNELGKVVSERWQNREPAEREAARMAEAARQFRPAAAYTVEEYRAR